MRFMKVCCAGAKGSRVPYSGVFWAFELSWRRSWGAGLGVRIRAWGVGNMIALPLKCSL